MLSKFRAVLFDFDGVVGRTMEDNLAAWKHALSAVQIQFEPQEYFLLEGKKPREVARHFTKHLSNVEDVAIDSICRSKEEHYLRHNKFAIYDGVNEVLKALKQNQKSLALVTGAGRGRVQATLSAEIAKHFDCIVTADDVAHGKPDPECYLTAARKLNCRADECLVIENAPLGIDSAKSAGMACFAVSTTLEPKFLARADKCMSNVSELLKIFKF